MTTAYELFNALVSAIEYRDAAESDEEKQLRHCAVMNIISRAKQLGFVRADILSVNKTDDGIAIIQIKR